MLLTAACHAPSPKRTWGRQGEIVVDTRKGVAVAVAVGVSETAAACMGRYAPPERFPHPQLRPASCSADTSLAPSKNRILGFSNHGLGRLATLGLGRLVRGAGARAPGKPRRHEQCHRHQHHQRARAGQWALRRGLL
eukprot:scaffold16579_cov130-Isochrysis_galbana.AAC.7